MKKLTALFVIAAIAVTMFASLPASAQVVFSDMDVSHWAMSSVERLVNAGKVKSFKNAFVKSKLRYVLNKYKNFRRINALSNEKLICSSLAMKHKHNLRNSLLRAVVILLPVAIISLPRLVFFLLHYRQWCW